MLSTVFTTNFMAHIENLTTAWSQAGQNPLRRTHQRLRFRSAILERVICVANSLRDGVTLCFLGADRRVRARKIKIADMKWKVCNCNKQNLQLLTKRYLSVARCIFRNDCDLQIKGSIKVAFWILPKNFKNKEKYFLTLFQESRQVYVKFYKTPSSIMVSRKKFS